MRSVVVVVSLLLVVPVWDTDVNNIINIMDGVSPVSMSALVSNEWFHKRYTQTKRLRLVVRVRTDTGQQDAMSFIRHINLYTDLICLRHYVVVFHLFFFFFCFFHFQLPK